MVTDPRSGIDYDAGIHWRQRLGVGVHISPLWWGLSYDRFGSYRTLVLGPVSVSWEIPDLRRDSR